MIIYQKKQNLRLPKIVHFWEVDGFVKLSDKARNKFEKLIKDYGVRKLTRDLKLDRETIDSIYRKSRGKNIHSIKHLLKIAKFIEYKISILEKEVISYGLSQSNIYKIEFPFVLTPLHLRVATIHGDGSFNKITNQCSWYQLHDRIKYMEELLQFLLKNRLISAKKKDRKISFITIPSILIHLV